MSHATLRNSYQSLTDRLNLFPQSAPPSELLFRILEVLFTRSALSSHSHECNGEFAARVYQ
jgi:hypothetical protein